MNVTVLNIIMHRFLQNKIAFHILKCMNIYVYIIIVTLYIHTMYIYICILFSIENIDE